VSEVVKVVEETKSEPNESQKPAQAVPRKSKLEE